MNRVRTTKMLLFIASWKKIIEEAERLVGAPRFSLDEQPDRYVLTGVTPGFLQHGWQVQALEGRLSVAGETQSRSGNGDTFGYVRSAPFEESFALPADADVTKVTASAKEHELSVEIPRLPTDRSTSPTPPTAPDRSSRDRSDRSSSP